MRNPLFLSNIFLVVSNCANVTDERKIRDKRLCYAKYVFRDAEIVYYRVEY